MKAKRERHAHTRTRRSVKDRAKIKPTEKRECAKGRRREGHRKEKENEQRNQQRCFPWVSSHLLFSLYGAVVADGFPSLFVVVLWKAK